MNVSCLPVSFFNAIAREEMSIQDWARMAREIGLDAVDLSVMLLKNHTPVYLKQIRDDIEAIGMSIAMMASYPDFSHPDRVQRERELEYLRHDIALSSYLGAKYLRITAGQAHPETTVDQGIAWVREGFRQAETVADRFKIQLLYENHSKPGAWHYPDFSQPTDIFLALADALYDTSIGINFDTANPQVFGDDPLPILQRVIEKVVTIHVADTSLAGQRVPVPAIIGEGLVPFGEIFSVLKQHHFDGWLCIEEASGTGREGIEKAVEFVRDSWES